MKLFVSALAVSTLVLGSGVTNKSEAAVLSGFTQSALGSTCDTQNAPAGSIVVSCGSFAGGDGIDARASYGNIGLRSQVRGGGGGDQSKDFWRGASAFFDTLSFSVNTGTFRLFTHIDAALIEAVTGSFFGSVNNNAGSNIFSVTVAGTEGFRRSHGYTNTGPGGTAILSSTDDLGNLGHGFIDLPFTGGQLDLVVSMNAQARCGAQVGGSGTCLLGVDSYNSLIVTGSDVIDDSGQVLPNGFVSSDSGFDYSEGIAVPLPATLWVLLTGIAGLVLLRRKA